MADNSAGTRLGLRAETIMAEAWPRIIQRVAAGELIKTIIQDEGISGGMLRTWRVLPERRAEWEAAREASADAFADMAIDEAMANKRGDEAAHARTRIDTLKWAARIRNPRAYSDKSQLDVNVRTVDLTRIISEANARLAGRAPRILEHDAPRALELLAPQLADLL